MKKTFLLIALISVAISSFAQEKKMLTPMDAAYQNRSIYPVGKNVKWLTNTDKYIFTEGNDLMVQDANAKKASVMLTLDQVNSYLNQAGMDSIKRLPNLTWIDANQAYYYSYDKNTNNINLNTGTVAVNSQNTFARA